MYERNNNLQEGGLMKHNVYFDGKVQSLSLDTADGRATVGVMMPGRYTFSTSTQERMVITSGMLAVMLPGENRKEIRAGQEFVVRADVSFDVEASRDVSYICYYG